jgi:hypothetical protein
VTRRESTLEIQTRSGTEPPDPTLPHVARPTAAPQTPDHVPFLGIDGLGVIEGKLSDDPIESQRQIIDDAGLRVSVSAARILTILPQPRILPKPARARFPGPNDLDARLEAWQIGLEKLVALGTETVLVCTGAAGEFSPRSRAIRRDRVPEGHGCDGRGCRNKTRGRTNARGIPDQRNDYHVASRHIGAPRRRR